ncbi:MAG: Ldh family oxidoreductase [Firmicutes bacterium]|jgi:LDH2 family malate/lactate/ureidoglycolate dehydrogenase|nr:Ldh family oxidoreductase [Bacillota bacterium]
MQHLVVPLAEVEDACLRALVSAGTPEHNARDVFEALVWADLRGIPSHGVRNLPVYLRRARDGGLDPSALPVAVREARGACLMDGRNGFGQVAGRRAVEVVKRLARANGIGAVWVRNTNHVGALGHYASLLACDGYASFMAGNANPTVAPHGGTEPRLGTNPVCFAFPGPNYPIIADMATSAVAKGKIYEMADRGSPIPEGWSLDSSGRPTTNAREALDGVLLPMAGPKGYALGVVVELLAGVFTGCPARRTRSLHKEPSKPQGVGFSLAAVRVQAVLDWAEYEDRVADFVSYVKSSRPAEGVEEVLLPGEREARLAAARATSGIPMTENDWAAIMREASRPACP